MTEPQTIVLAKVEMDGFELTNEYERFDGYNYRRKGRTIPRAMAMVWLIEGTAEDLEKAKAYADKEGYTVSTFTVTEPDPLGKAKAAILADYK